MAILKYFNQVTQEWEETSLGQQGPRGPEGVQGPSPYQVAVDAGFVGTIEEWLATLNGDGWIPTDVKIADYTAAQNESIPCNTTNASFTVTLPATGGRVWLYDAVGNAEDEGFGVNSLFVAPGVGRTVMGDATLEIDVGASSTVLELAGTDWRIVGGTTTAVSLTTQDYVLPSNLYRWLTIALSDNVTPVGTGENIEYYQVQEDMTIQQLWFTTPAQAPSGSSAIIAVKANGVSIFGTNPEIVAGATTSGALVPTTSNIPAGTVLTFDIVQVGAINTGLGYRITMKTVGG